MSNTDLRVKLTDKEYNTVLKYTSRIGVDQSFDLVDCGEKDLWRDWEETNADMSFMSLKEGFDLLYDAAAYPFSHENMTAEESTILTNLFIEFIGVTEDQVAWLLK